MEKIIIGMIALIIAIVIFVGVDKGFGTDQYKPCVVKGKRYVRPHTTSTWVSTGENSGYMRTTHHPERFVLIILDPAHVEYERDVGSLQYQTAVQGDEGNFQFTTGWITGTVY